MCCRSLFAVAALLVPRVLSATILANWDVDELVRRADLIVVGRVTAQMYVRVGGMLMTESTVRVSSTLMGDPVEQFTLSQLGGRDGNTVVESVGDARLVPGHDYLLITFGHKDGRRYLVGMALGAMRADGEHLVQEVDVPLTDGRGRISPPPGRRLRFLPDVIAAIRRAGR